METMIDTAKQNRYRETKTRNPDMLTTGHFVPGNHNQSQPRKRVNKWKYV